MKKILIVSANYYEAISNNLLNEAEQILNRSKIKFELVTVPGIFEIPVIISKNIKRYDGFVALGCVIKGETPHFDLISKATFNGLMKLSIESKKPIGNGIITSVNLKQAQARSSTTKKSSKKNKGKEAVNAVISVLKNVTKK